MTSSSSVPKLAAIEGVASAIDVALDAAIASIAVKALLIFEVDRFNFNLGIKFLPDSPAR